jgi:hypothetical protein
MIRKFGYLRNLLIGLGEVEMRDEQRRIVAYLDGLQAKVNALRGLQSQSQEELDALLLPPTGMISVVRPSGGAFKGEL